MTTISRLMLAGALTLGLGCGGETEGAPTTAGEDPSAAAAAPEAASAPSSSPSSASASAGGGDLCARAARCCTAYIEATVAANPAAGGTMNAETTCAGVRQAATSGAAGEAVCQAAIDSWREGLAALPGGRVPSECE